MIDARYFQSLPLLGCIRDRRGRIVEVTDKLLEAEGRPRRSVIGKHIASIWPGGTEWLARDREALAARKPLVRLEYSGRSGWLRSTRVPQRGQVVWVGEVVTAEVQLAATRLVLSELVGIDELSALAAATGKFPHETLPALLDIIRGRPQAA